MVVLAGFAAVVVDVDWALGGLANAALIREDEKLRYCVRDGFVNSWKAPRLADGAAIVKFWVVKNAVTRPACERCGTPSRRVVTI